jgi:hypothetical protein
MYHFKGLEGITFWSVVVGRLKWLEMEKPCVYMPCVATLALCSRPRQRELQGCGPRGSPGVKPRGSPGVKPRGNSRVKLRGSPRVKARESPGVTSHTPGSVRKCEGV